MRPSPVTVCGVSNVSADRAIECSGEWTVEWQSPWVIWWAVLVPGPTNHEVIDMHTHFFPRGLPDLAAQTGDPRWPSLDETGSRIMLGAEVFRPVAPSCSDLSARAAAMASTAVTRQVLSPVPITLTTWASAALADQFLRTQNDLFAAEIAQAEPETFGWMCAVPMQDPALASAELVRCVEQLGAIGVQIGSEVGDVELDDARFDEFYATAQSLNVPIFVHPTDVSGAIRRQVIPYEFGLGMLTDTALVATALVFGGVLERHPSLRVGLAHGCGTFAVAYPRLKRGATLAPPSAVPAAGADLDSLVARLWADTLVFDPMCLPLLIERFGAEHLMLGSDFPFYPTHFGDPLDMLSEATRCGQCTESQRVDILGPNARHFFERDVALTSSD